MKNKISKLKSVLGLSLAMVAMTPTVESDARPEKPLLHGKHWVAITGKPLGATAGARIFHQGGNAVDAAITCALATPR